MLTKEQLEKDKAKLEEQRAFLLANLHATEGALKYVTEKLAELEAGEKEKENG